MRTTYSFNPEVTAAARARAFVRQVLQGIDRWRIEDMVLVVSELVSNATEHDGGGVLTVTKRPNCVRIEVSDSDRRLPVLREATAEDERGRGLMIVDALAASWGAQPSDTGKVVWCEFERAD